MAVCSDGYVDRAAIHQSVRRRGPDAFASLRLEIAPDVHVEATSAVLRLRGAVGGLRSAGSPGGVDGEMLQPAMAAPSRSCSQASSCLSFLEWNGEVFGGALQLPPEVSDTTAVLERLHQLEHDAAAGFCDTFSGTANVRYAAALATAQASFSESCVRFFEREIEGPYAFVYYAHSLRLFLFGRDPLGRRSLLLHVAAVSPAAREEGERIASESNSVEVAIASVSGGHLHPRCTRGAATGEGSKRARGDPDGQAGESDKESERNGATPLFSVSSGCCWQEIPNTGLFAIDVAVSSEAFLVSHYPWAVAHGVHPLLRFQSRPQLSPATGQLEGIDEEKMAGECPAIIRCLLRESGVLAPPLLQEATSFEVAMATRYLKSLWRAVAVRVKAENCGADPTRPIGVLFSGGIDCTVLAAIAHYVLPATTPIELINVAFGEAPELAPDRLATFRALEQLLRLPTRLKGGDQETLRASGREWRLVLVDVPHNANVSHIESLVCPGNSIIDMSIGTALWHAAQGCGRMQRVRADEELVPRMRSGAHSRVSHKFYRVSTEKARVACELQGVVPTSGDAENEAKFAPLLEAIITELEAFNEASSSPVLLSTLGKDHATSLRPVLCKYGYKKLGSYLNDAAAAGVIAFARHNEAPSKAIRLVRPADMEKVRRVAPARWLVDAGESSPLGSCVDNYTCASRVLLLGMGADETLGGYVRHRRAFERRGVKGLTEELHRDFARLWKRNLGRDDRVVSDSGREGRYPYLDEEVLGTLDSIAAEAYRRAADTARTTAAASLDTEAALREALAPVCCFGADDGPPGVGDKKILRLCASVLGLGDVVRLQKRAIQFGSRVAQAPP
ncbi:asparagine synthase (glutamine-hydrolyzing) [Trypanosoma conorhini]|uniref:Asparagine synthase (Glutamine-hydrolyzing) n=1 Tax=Trypanosoma conorhini TaxID=83891 RepID=A0A3R7S5D2_9TRYP|nr:asparagine synthase (glutamine-hydrolyzing) [Trypanosoma conorhini]RNF21713.1 asparagine synthase (glutamine-hydrolyzing) [Trypanosoma conorhini]